MTVPENELSRCKKVALGLLILAEYDGDIAAGHDIIYAGPTDTTRVSAEDQVKLNDLGWHIDSNTDSWARQI